MVVGRGGWVRAYASVIIITVITAVVRLLRNPPANLMPKLQVLMQVGLLQVQR